MKKFPAAHGAFLALLSAILFGASTPLVQHVGTHVSSWLTAALLYAGASVAGLLMRSTVTNEASLQRQHWPRLLLMAFFGAVLGPVALAWGLQRTSGMGASLMLTFEAVFTAFLSFVLYKEHISRRVMLAIALLTLGGALLVFDRAESGETQVLGLLAILVATLAWAIDNTLSHALADLDPGRVILAKATVGAVCSLMIASITGQAVLSLTSGAGLFLIGAFGYGLSLRFYLLAQRAFGAARTGSVFAAAPFIGAAVAFWLGERDFSLWLLGGAVMMLIGVVLHITEQHEHAHVHETVAHDHAHTHDDGHHNHTHDPMPTAKHSHAHTHEAITHRHPHLSDVHHRHSH
jgi:drug/metabolite transporter (DMT)-like permease